MKFLPQKARKTKTTSEFHSSSDDISDITHSNYGGSEGTNNNNGQPITMNSTTTAPVPAASASMLEQQGRAKNNSQSKTNEKSKDTLSKYTKFSSSPPNKNRRSTTEDILSLPTTITPPRAARSIHNFRREPLLSRSMTTSHLHKSISSSGAVSLDGKIIAATTTKQQQQKEQQRPGSNSPKSKVDAMGRSQHPKTSKSKEVAQTTCRTRDEKNNGTRRPKIRQHPEWDTCERSTTVTMVPHGSRRGGLQRAFSKSCNNLSELDKQQQSPTNEDDNNKSDIEILGIIVKVVHAALSSLSYNGGGAKQNNSRQYEISFVKFHPDGCIWDAIIHASSSREEGEKKKNFALPIQVACIASDDDDDGIPPVDRNKNGMGYTIELSLHNNDNDTHKVWNSNPSLVKDAMHWVRSLISYSLKQSELYGKSSIDDDARLMIMPLVSILLPREEKKTESSSDYALARRTTTALPTKNGESVNKQQSSLRTKDLISSDEVGKWGALHATAIKTMTKEKSFSEGEVRIARQGLLSQRSMRRLSSDDDVNDNDDDDAKHAPNPAPQERVKVIKKNCSPIHSSRRRQLLPQESKSSLTLTKEMTESECTQPPTFVKESSSTAVPEEVIQTMKRGKRGSFTSGQERMRDVGKKVNSKDFDDDGSIEMAEVNDSFARQKLIEQAQLGLLSGKSMAELDIDHNDLRTAVQLQQSQTSSHEKTEVQEHHITEGELRLAKLGCLSKKSMQNFRDKGVLKKSNSVTFSDADENRDSTSPTSYVNRDDDIDTDTEKVDKVDKVTPIATARKAKKSSDDEVDNNDTLVFSSNELLKKDSDILTEGQYFLGISMLVYMYSHLRETCRMGHTRCKMEDIDVHSHQSQYRVGETTKYLDDTKTAGSVIRIVIDELDYTDENEEENDIVGDENKEYEKSITAQFRSWIEDSRINQLDEETKVMIAEMKRKVARHRWRRAISAVILSYRISGGKPPKWENPVVAPGCENQNRFVDMNAMVSEAMRTQPKYFTEGSVMHNLIESGIELVWFSDMSQSDVVYGICVQRKEKKVTVVFRGTVNAHNWKMNLKFDTNEYRNPVKQNYPGRVDELSLHSGFALYLLRKRKDTGMSKLQEIFDKIDEIGREMAPDGNYKLSITGHSLGGALATLCGFYVAARSRFAHLPTIYVWSFAAPRVGTQAFIHAWQHLERTGRIRHARFSSTHDLVPLVPFCNFEVDDLQFYKHVGLRVQLHGVGRIGKWRIQRNLDVTYPLRHDWPSEIRRVFMNNILANLTTPANLKNNHSLTQYQKRLHFTMTYKKALGSGVLHSDKRRNRIKTLDEYYHIRANITSASIAQEILDQSKVSNAAAKKDSSRTTVVILVTLLLLTWLYLILSVSTDIFEKHPITFETVLTPISLVASGISHMLHLPVTLPMAVYEGVSWQARKFLSSILPHNHDTKRTAFVGRSTNSKLNSLMNELAVERTNRYLAMQHSKALVGAQDIILSSDDSTRLQIFDSATKGLFNLAALVDNGLNPQLTIPTSSNLPDMKMESDVNNLEEEDAGDDKDKHTEQAAADLKVAEAKLKPLQEYATSVTFDPKLDNGLYLVGAGVRKKSIVKLYAVAMYSSATVLSNASSSSTLHAAARSFDQSTSATAFVLEMVYSVGAEKIAGAIADSVKPRYVGSPSDISSLESLIVDGVNSIGGQASKGTIFRFDCSSDGVGVSVNGKTQGTAKFAGLGSAFVDVFMDKDAVSPTLVDSCVETWSNKEAKVLSSSLVQLNKLLLLGADSEHDQHDEQPAKQTDNQATDLTTKHSAIESKMKPLKDYATSVTFDPKLDDGLYLIGVGVRKKSIISVYAVSMYSSAAVIETLSRFPKGKQQRQDASESLRSTARTFGHATPSTTFVLEMTYSAGAEKIAGAIGESVKPRYEGSPTDVNALESLIIDGVNRKGGQASKGTIFRFECSEDGVSVSVDGTVQGTASYEGLGSAFVDVFMDSAAVSPTLVDSCLDTWTGVSLD